MKVALALLLPLFSLVASACSAPPVRARGIGEPPERTLVLGEVARGDTRAPDGRGGSSCKGGGRAGQALDHLYGFEVRETASYRFTLVPETFEGVVQVQQKDPNKPWFFGIGCMAARAGGEAVVSLALAPGFYQVVVDGNLWDEAGPYTLKVDRDTSSTAMLRPEDRGVVGPLCEGAREVRLGERYYGTYHSTSGGARASCGLLGGDAVHRISLAAGKQVRVRVAAHFRPALEIRSGCQAAALGCARAEEGRTEAEIEVHLPAGESYLVVDAAELGERSRYGASTAAVVGAYVLDVDEVTR